MKTNTAAKKLEALTKTLRADGIGTDALAFEVTEMNAETTVEADEDGYSNSTSYRGVCCITISGCIKATLNIVGDEVDCELNEDTEVLGSIEDEEMIDDLNDWVASYDPKALAEYLTLRFSKDIEDAMTDARDAEADSADYASDPYRYYGVSRADF
jgi:uncharacterized protein YuzE